MSQPPVPPVLLAPVFELELVLFAAVEFEFEAVLLLDVEFLALLFVTVVRVAGLAALVVGTTSGGAPVVSSLPAPLPPHAASATAASTAAPATSGCLRRLRFQ